MSKKTLGIDFGTRSFKIYRKGDGIILNEKNVIAIEKNPFVTPGLPYVENKRIKAGGDLAFEMLEKAPMNISVTYPVRNGVIADFDNMQKLFEYFLEKTFKSKNARKSFSYMAAVPTDITGVEKKGFYDLIANVAGSKKNIQVVEKPIAAAAGMNIDVINSRGVMVVDVGADTTEVSVLSLGGIVISKLLHVGGSSFDDSVRQGVKKTYGLYIGDRTAEYLKLKLSDAFEGDESTEKVFGRNVFSGLPSQVEVESSLVREVMREQIYTIADHVKAFLERTPPEIAAEIKDDGIYLTGGSSKIRNLDKLISESTGIKVNCPVGSENCVAIGLGKIMEQSRLSKLSYYPKHEKTK